MLYMDATDLTLNPNQAGLTFSYGMALSDNGDRLVLDSYEVRDASFGVIGRLAMPDSNYSPLVSMPSPDGRRIYVLTYPRDSSYQVDPVLKPRIFVFDSSVAPAGSQYLPTIGYFDLNDYPSCHVNFTETCSSRMAISPDEKTLFIVGGQNFIVAPIPTLTPVAVASSASRGLATAQSVSTKAVQPVSKPVRWQLNSSKP